MLVRVATNTEVITWLAFELSNGKGRAQRTSNSGRIDKDFPDYAAACNWVSTDSGKFKK